MATMKRVPVTGDTETRTTKSGALVIVNGPKVVTLTAEQSTVALAAIGPDSILATLRRGYVDVPVGKRGRKPAERTSLASLASAARAARKADKAGTAPAPDAPDA